MFRQFNQHQEELNRRRAIIDRLQQENNIAEAQVVRLLDPLDRDLRRLDHLTELLTIQKELLEHHPDEPVEILRAMYHERLEEVPLHFIEDYRNVLRARTHVLRNDHIVVLDNELKTQLIEELRVQIQSEACSFPQFNPEGDRALIIANLSSHFEALMRQITHILDEKTRITIQWRNFERTFLLRAQAVEEAPIESNPLFAAVEHENIAEVRRLLGGYFHSCPYLNQHGIAGMTPIQQACLYGNVEIVQLLLLRKGADLRVSDINDHYLPIHYAVAFPNQHTIEILELILEKMQKDNIPLDCLGPYARTAFHTATFFGNLAAAQWLYHHGANALAVDTSTGNTPLHNAAMRGHFDIMAFLLEANISPFVYNINHESPLLVAILGGHTQGLEVFISRGVWLNAQEVTYLAGEMDRHPGLRQNVGELLQGLAASLGFNLALEHCHDQPCAEALVAARQSWAGNGEGEAAASNPEEQTPSLNLGGDHT